MTDINILCKSTAAFHKLPPSHLATLKRGLGCGDVSVGMLASPNSDNINAARFMSSREYHLKINLFFFFLRNLISGEKKEETTVVKFVALRIKLASVCLKPQV